MTHIPSISSQAQISRLLWGVDLNIFSICLAITHPEIQWVTASSMCFNEFKMWRGRNSSGTCPFFPHLLFWAQRFHICLTWQEWCFSEKLSNAELYCFPSRFLFYLPPSFLLPWDSSLKKVLSVMHCLRFSFLNEGEKITLRENRPFLNSRAYFALHNHLWHNCIKKGVHFYMPQT